MKSNRQYQWQHLKSSVPYSVSRKYHNSIHCDVGIRNHVQLLGFLSFFLRRVSKKLTRRSSITLIARLIAVLLGDAAHLVDRQEPLGEGRTASVTPGPGWGQSDWQGRPSQINKVPIIFHLVLHDKEQLISFTFLPLHPSASFRRAVYRRRVRCQPFP